MFSLQRFFGQDDKFFNLLEASAEQACHSVTTLIAMLKQPHAERHLDEFIQTRRKEKRINEEITEQLCKTFVTPLEREDIEGLSDALYKIPKTVEKFGERLLICQDKCEGVDFGQQTRILEEATTTLSQMVKGLRGKANLEKMRELNERLHFFEGEADKLMLGLLQDIYSGRYDPLQVIILRGLYELLEKVTDRCLDAGNVVFHIVLKNS